jgi:hypothetical protein
MEIKPGYKTTEAWVTAFVNIAAAILAILAVRGLITAEEQSVYLTLAQALIAGLAPLVMAFVSGRYINARAQVKAAANGKPAA